MKKNDDDYQQVEKEIEEEKYQEGSRTKAIGTGAQKKRWKFILYGLGIGIVFGIIACMFGRADELFMGLILFGLLGAFGGLLLANFDANISSTQQSHGRAWNELKNLQLSPKEGWLGCILSWIVIVYFIWKVIGALRH